MRPKKSPISTPKPKLKTTHGVIPFPPAWLWWVDELIPTWVKKNYSPRDSWKDKPFTKDDSFFFFRGVEELSELFTDERPAHLPAYFAHPKFRSSYLLYFLPLQAAKFLSVFQLHSKAYEAALETGKKTGVIRIGDLGAGPGTASLAFLLRLLQEKEIPNVELYWVDTNKSILEDGRALVEQLANQFPRLRGKVKVSLHVGPWWEAARFLPEKMSLILMGNVLNESQIPRALSQAVSNDFSEEDLDDESPKKRAKPLRLWAELMSRVDGGGILFLEPAIRRSSQLLSNLRDELIDSGLLENSPTSIWGPCLHAGACPLSQGRDWCHFSVPVDIPGKWFAQFSKGLGSERQWVKFSYLWLASKSAPSTRPAANLRRVISDPLQAPSGGPRSTDTVLICEPERTEKLRLPSAQRTRRGDLIKI